MSQSICLSEQEERCEIGVHNVCELFRRVVHRGLADIRAHVVYQNIKQPTEMLFNLYIHACRGRTTGRQEGGQDGDIEQKHG